jgi:hypothetical protein
VSRAPQIVGALALLTAAASVGWRAAALYETPRVSPRPRTAAASAPK